ncbi:hypothetical protein [Halalkalicoccus jeotgali]|uniref:DUF8163 domain-containing protein n=1 Tax=Halalkalicoccus jeotgali (strain DSM 18796 / CECT 7217 / JCM 14584 / KCTC 4019 / B3) TaxID=795797 RepID=D8J761_HALJB|nr:hypothetical protein [Halalkalicoccus jeotgali]ADJ13956.1 hypothetical protein HacjB3_02815 [Halalkalicoccus jeotgali B3]ELY34001.1 hypothetical protein C497_16507 [Halalkalicoccus jeotgali B3]
MSTDPTTTDSDTAADEAATEREPENDDTTTEATATTDDPNRESELSVPSVSTQQPQEIQLIGLLGLAIVAAGFWLLAEWIGLLGVAGIALTWYGLSSPYAVAIGHAMFLPVASRSLTVEPAVLVAEVGLITLLLAPAIDTGATERFIGAFLVSLLGLGGLAAGAYWWSDRLWIGAAVLIGALGVAGYGLYRYEQVSLGLIGTETESEAGQIGNESATTEDPI